MLEEMSIRARAIYLSPPRPRVGEVWQQSRTREEREPGMSDLRSVALAHLGSVRVDW